MDKIVQDAFFNELEKIAVTWGHYASKMPLWSKIKMWVKGSKPAIKDAFERKSEAFPQGMKIWAQNEVARSAGRRVIKNTPTIKGRAMLDTGRYKKPTASSGRFEEQIVPATDKMPSTSAMRHIRE